MDVALVSSFLFEWHLQILYLQVSHSETWIKEAPLLWGPVKPPHWIEIEVGMSRRISNKRNQGPLKCIRGKAVMNNDGADGLSPLKLHVCRSLSTSYVFYQKLDVTMSVTLLENLNSGVTLNWYILLRNIHYGLIVTYLVCRFCVVISSFHLKDVFWAKSKPLKLFFMPVNFYHCHAYKLEREHTRLINRKYLLYSTWLRLFDTKGSNYCSRENTFTRS